MPREFIKESVSLFYNPDGSFRDGQVNRVERLSNGVLVPATAKTLDAEDVDAVLAPLGASILTQRDALQAQVTNLTAQLATANGLVEPLQAQVAALQAELDTFKNPPYNPRHLAPYVFLSLLKPEEIVALQTSPDPVVIVGRSKLQTIITYIDLDHPDTIGLAQYMESKGLIAEGRAAQILAGESPS
jgi:hypothetical protein